jgi:hypothetical protein
VIVLSSDPDLFDCVRAAVRSDSRFIDVGDALHCDGSASPLSNIYPVQNDPIDWEDWDAAAGMPDPCTMSALIFESRSAEWVAEVGKLIAAHLDAPTWFIDSTGAAWPADQVDPDRVALA